MQTSLNISVALLLITCSFDTISCISGEPELTPSERIASTFSDSIAVCVCKKPSLSVRGSSLALSSLSRRSHSSAASANRIGSVSVHRSFVSSSMVDSDLSVCAVVLGGVAVAVACSSSSCSSTGVSMWAMSMSSGDNPSPSKLLALGVASEGPSASTGRAVSAAASTGAGPVAAALARMLWPTGVGSLVAFSSVSTAPVVLVGRTGCNPTSSAESTGASRDCATSLLLGDGSTESTYFLAALSIVSRMSCCELDKSREPFCRAMSFADASLMDDMSISRGPIGSGSLSTPFPLGSEEGPAQGLRSMAGFLTSVCSTSSILPRIAS